MTWTWTSIVAAGVLGNVAVWYFRRRERRIERQRITRLLLAEYSYWADSDPPDPDGAAIQIGAIGAISNVIAAVGGHPAPWHQSQKGEGEPCQKSRK